LTTVHNLFDKPSAETLTLKLKLLSIHWKYERFIDRSLSFMSENIDIRVKISFEIYLKV
jgi:hypothetical protein